MPVIRKQKSKARRSRKADMISDLENMDVMIRSGHFEREDREVGNSVKKPESPSYDALIDHNYNSDTKSRENEMRGFAGNTTGVDSASDLNRLYGELNQRVK